ncbi:hypothetical protein CLV98_10759 [Dyadobacter jejuensis]|uniref:Uncharacterized protein n=2 Tax=Dyadobacter jejuensis TaxID=1082580 RepID=A0A316AI17_9BACT|nr:hypothetical protein CLV98_10759 [Dyadobacter jejuensis]
MAENIPVTQQYTYNKTTQDGKKIKIVETRIKDIRFAELTIYTEGYRRNIPLEIGAIDPVDRVELADIDQNGEEELIIFTKELEGNRKGDFMILANSTEGELTKIETEPLDPKEYLRDGMLEGYLGFDRFSIEEDRLVRTYPYFDVNQYNSKNNGKTRQVIYKLHDLQILMKAP